MTILGELREGAVFREQMPKNDWPKEQNKKRNSKTKTQGLPKNKE